MNKYKRLSEKFDGWVIVFTMLMLTVHDYLFNNLLFNTPAYYLAGWKDVIVLIFLVYIILAIYQYSLRTGNISKEKIHYLLMLFLFILVALYGISNGLLGNASNYRFYFLVAFFSAFYAWLILKNFNYNIRYFETGLYFSLVISLLYGYYQYYTVIEPEDFWYWNHFISLGYEQNIWDAFRVGKPRISSFFTSSLDYSLFLLACFSFLLSFLYLSWVQKKQIKILVNLLFLIVIFHSIYISTVRSALIGGLGVLFLFVSYVIVRNVKFRIFISFATFTGLTISTFAYILLGLTEELSALGRVDQWVSFFGLIKGNFLFGLGVANVGAKGSYWYDSFWINYFLSFGVFIGAAVLLFFSRIYVGAVKELTIRNDKIAIMCLLPLSLMAPIFFYLFFFHSFSRTPSLYLFVTVFFISYMMRKKSYYMIKCYMKP